MINVNRIFPGVSAENGGSGPEILAYNIWNHIWGNTSNVDVGIDLRKFPSSHSLNQTILTIHADTPSSGGDTSLWCYADFRAPYVSRLAKLLQPGTLKIDVGEPGSIETTFIQHQIPSLTVEIGQAKIWNTTLIDRTVAFVNRVLVDLHMTPSTTNTTIEPDLTNTYIANTFHDTTTKHGGFVETLVDVDETVTKGQPIAKVLNPFGDVLETLFAPQNGRMFNSPRDPAVGPGDSVGQIVYNSSDPACVHGCIFSGSASGARR